MLNPLNLVKKIFKSHNQSELDRIKKIVKKINDKESDISKIENSEFPLRTQKLKAELKNGKDLDNILPDAFALVREASKRTTGERHFDVQLVGGVVLHESKIAEMKTGDWKDRPS